MIITENPYQRLEIKDSNEGVALVEKIRRDEEWINKVVIMNRNEALKLALFILEKYGYAGRVK